MSAPTTQASSRVASPSRRDDPDSGFYWRGLERHTILVQHCEDCGRVRTPPMPGCPYCACTATTVRALNLAGRLYSWVTVRATGLVPTLADDVPVSIGAVELEGGARLFARLELASAPTIGLALRAVFVDHSDWTELRFTDQSMSATAAGRDSSKPVRGSVAADGPAIVNSRLG